MPTLNLPSDKSIVILPAAARLFQQYIASDIFKTIQKLKTAQNVKQVLLWLTMDNFPEHDYLPGFVEHMADIVVKLQSKSELELLIRKATGSVTKKQYQYEIKDHFMVNEIKKKKETPVVEAPQVRPESLGTFKIELSEKDRIARNNLVLPFEKYVFFNSKINPFKYCNKSDSLLSRHLKIEEETKPPPTGGKIIYDLDRDDDFDEEDPDDDLDI